jgi:hypothetical protein
VLVKCFGALPSAIREEIDAAATAQIEVWFDAAIDAPDLATVFGLPRH